MYFSLNVVYFSTAQKYTEKGLAAVIAVQPPSTIGVARGMQWVHLHPQGGEKNFFQA